MGVFAHYTSGWEAFPTLLVTVFCLILVRIVATCLGFIALSADVAVFIALEVLLDSAGVVIELALMYLAVPDHSGVDNSVGHLRVGEFKYYRRYIFKVGFLSKPSYIGDLCFRDYCIIIYKYLLDSCFLIPNIDRVCRDTVSDDPIY
jgi:hypothetical protein